MEVVEFNVKGKKGLPLSVFKAEPKGTPKGIVQIFHGMGEHKDRYIDFSKFLALNGYAVYVHDHRKHGKSLEKPEELGIFEKEETWLDVIDDCYLVSRVAKKEQPKVPFIILGHSMGSVIARCFLAKYEGIAHKAIIMGPPPKMSKRDLLGALAGAQFFKIFKGKNKR